LSAPTDLACFDKADLDAIAGGVKREIARKLMPSGRASRLREELVLRDEASAYYAFGIASLELYRWDGKAWSPAKKLPAVLEGPASLALYTLKEREAASIDAKPAMDALGFLRGLVDGTRRAYRRGELTLSQAEALLSSFYAQDNAGRMWAVGAFTGAWYVFGEKRWQRSHEPKPSAFSRGATPADGELMINDGVTRFIAETDGAPPEALTAAWQPPATRPESLPPSLQVSTLSDLGERSKVRSGQSSPAPCATESALSGGRVGTKVRSSQSSPAPCATESALSGGRVGTKVHQTHADDESASGVRPTADDVDPKRRSKKLATWLIALGAVLVLLLVGSGVVAAQIRPWDKGAEKRWKRFVAPVARLLP
jgi:hypothetical protein